MKAGGKRDGAGRKRGAIGNNESLRIYVKPGVTGSLKKIANAGNTSVTKMLNELFETVLSVEPIREFLKND